MNHAFPRRLTHTLLLQPQRAFAHFWPLFMHGHLDVLHLAVLQQEQPAPAPAPATATATATATAALGAALTALFVLSFAAGGFSCTFLSALVSSETDAPSFGAFGVCLSFVGFGFSFCSAVLPIVSALSVSLCHVWA